MADYYGEREIFISKLVGIIMQMVNNKSKFIKILILSSNITDWNLKLKRIYRVLDPHTWKLAHYHVESKVHLQSLSNVRHLQIITYDTWFKYLFV